MNSGAKDENDYKGQGVKNPDHEAENPGGQPSEAVKGSAPPHPVDPEGQQGTTTPNRH